MPGAPGCAGCVPGTRGGCGCPPAAPGLGLVGGVGWPGCVVDAPGGWGCAPGAPGGAPAAGWTAGEVVAGLGFFLTSTGWNCTWFAGACTWLAGTILLVTVGGGTGLFDGFGRRRGRQSLSEGC